MSKTTPSFRQIATPLDVDDAALAKLNDSLGVPTLVKPPKAETGQIPALDARSPLLPADGSQNPKTEPKAKKTASASITPLNPTEKLTIELPGYLTDAMKRYTVERRISLRHMVMLGMQALGLTVEPQDLVPDARRTRHKTGKS